MKEGEVLGLLELLLQLLRCETWLRRLQWLLRWLLQLLLQLLLLLLPLLLLPLQLLLLLFAKPRRSRQRLIESTPGILKASNWPFSVRVVGAGKRCGESILGELLGSIV